MSGSQGTTLEYIGSAQWCSKRCERVPLIDNVYCFLKDLWNSPYCASCRLPIDRLRSLDQTSSPWRCTQFVSLIPQSAWIRVSPHLLYQWAVFSVDPVGVALRSPIKYEVMRKYSLNTYPLVTPVFLVQYIALVTNLQHSSTPHYWVRVDAELLSFISLGTIRAGGTCTTLLFSRTQVISNHSLASCASVIAQMLDRTVRTADHLLICVMQPVTGYDNVEWSWAFAIIENSSYAAIS